MPKKLAQVPYEYTLYEYENGHLGLSVDCGTTAVYTLTIALTSEEKVRYAMEGELFIQVLANNIIGNPDGYKKRHQASKKILN